MEMQRNDRITSSFGSMTLGTYYRDLHAADWGKGPWALVAP